MTLCLAPSLLRRSLGVLFYFELTWDFVIKIMKIAHIKATWTDIILFLNHFIK